MYESPARLSADDRPHIHQALGGHAHMPTIAQLVGQDNTTIVETTIVEHVHSRKTFAQQRRDALTRQRDNTQARLNSLRQEIRKITAKAEVATDAAFIQDAIAKLERMGSAEKKLVDDIARLTAKIGA